MKKCLLFAALLALAFAAVLPSAARAETWTFNFSGRAPDAAFFTYDGCLYSEVILFTAEGSFHAPPSKPDASTFADLWFYSEDSCAGTYRWGYGYAEGIAFSIGRTLDGATLTGTIPVEYYDSATDSWLADQASVNLSWTATSSAARGNGHQHWAGESFVVNSRFNGTFREATAAGTVLLAGTNLTPGPSSFAGLQSVKTGSVEVYH